MYLDLLMTLYNLASDGDLKEFYSKNIKRYLEHDDLEAKPLTFAIDTVVRFSSPSILGTSYLYVPSTSFVEWMHSINAHLGGTVTATWSGTTPYIGSVTWGDHWTNVDNRWDDKPYENDLKDAQKWADLINGTVISYRAESDGITRDFKDWGASVSSSNTHPAGSADPGHSYIAPTIGTCGTAPNTYSCQTDPGRAHKAASGNNGSDGAYSITVTGGIQPRRIDGPSSIYDLPSLQDTWTQTINYDYTKITKAKVWKIHRSKVTGMVSLTGTEELEATITQGDPTVFSNIANDANLLTKASAEGRLRHSIEPQMHDEVVWNLGPRSNLDDGRGANGWITGPGQGASWATGSIYTNSSKSQLLNYHVTNSTAEDRTTTEWKEFDKKRKLLNEVTVVSDFLILQTSSGDQSVMYFQQIAPEVQTQAPSLVPKTSFATQWDNNLESAAKWKKDKINIGSYNGNYSTPSNKYSKTGTKQVVTKLDTGPAKIFRPARPTAPLRLALTNIDVIDTNANGEYITGVSNVFYQNIIDKGVGNTPFALTQNTRYLDKGEDFITTYSPTHDKVNDIVIHNPVSAEDAIVIPLDNARDQRTLESQTLGGNLQQPTVDYERRLKAGYVFTPSPPVYTNTTVANPSYVPAKAAVASEFAFTGSTQTFTAPRDGDYTIQVWGAQGGNTAFSGEYQYYNPEHGVYIYYPSASGYEWSYCTNHASYYTGVTRGGGTAAGGKGGYAAGIITLTANTTLSINVGGKGSDGASGQAPGGWNGGGFGNTYSGGGGGGTDVRKGGTALSNRIIVAGGGGGSQVVRDTTYKAPGGDGGGLYGNNGVSHGYWSSSQTSGGGTQTAGGLASGTLEYRWYNSAHSMEFWYPAPVGYETYYCTTEDHRSYYTGQTRASAGTSGNAGTSGQGGNAKTSYQGGGGGGYFGGASGAYQGYSGAGGSGYVGGMTTTSMGNGHQSGNGLVRITTPGAPAIGSPTMVVPMLTSPGLTEPPESAYEYIAVVNDPKAAVESPLGTFEPGKFINLDYPFQIYFPNIGNFYGNGATGIASTSSITGKGFIDRMNTTEWTKSKQVKFNFYTNHNGVTYAPGDWINLELTRDTFDFYLPLANSEAVSALVEFRAIANNADDPDGESVRNKVREFNLGAKHSAIKPWNIDLVGRIGGLVIEDTGDFRFSNLFKQPLTPTQWLVPNVIKKVNQNAQNAIIGDNINIRGEAVSASNNYLDTYGLLPHLKQQPILLPLSPDKNNVVPLQRQPMRLGYNVLSDIQTIGNYYDKMQVIPYYYSLDLNNGSISPVDIYMDVDGYLKPINKSGAAVTGWDPSYSLDWNTEAGRRNVSEAAHTNNVVADNTYTTDAGSETTIGKPYGSQYQFGTAQIMYLTERNRTFIGTEYTYGVDRNPTDRLHPLSFGKQGQRWHFTYGLPSSAVAVKKDLPATQVNIDALKTNTTVLVVALDIKAIGNTYALQYKKANGSVNIAGTSWSLSSIPHPVVSIYSANKSSADDLTTSGTHLGKKLYSQAYISDEGER